MSKPLKIPHQIHGQFDDRMYEYILKNNMSLDARTFEEIARENIAIKKLNDMLTKDVRITDEEVLENYKTAIKEAKEPQKFDEEKFKKEKDEYLKRVLNMKKDKLLEEWLRKCELATRLNIKLDEYEQYYR